MALRTLAQDRLAAGSVPWAQAGFVAGCVNIDGFPSQALKDTGRHGPASVRGHRCAGRCQRRASAAIARGNAPAAERRGCAADFRGGVRALAGRLGSERLEASRRCRLRPIWHLACSTSGNIERALIIMAPQPNCRWSSGTRLTQRTAYPWRRPSLTCSYQALTEERPDCSMASAVARSLVAMLDGSKAMVCCTSFDRPENRTALAASTWASSKILSCRA